MITAFIVSGETTTRESIVLDEKYTKETIDEKIDEILNTMLDLMSTIDEFDEDCSASVSIDNNLKVTVNKYTYSDDDDDDDEAPMPMIKWPFVNLQRRQNDQGNEK
jgi:hypothetical protein